MHNEPAPYRIEIIREFIPFEAYIFIVILQNRRIGRTSTKKLKGKHIKRWLCSYYEDASIYEILKTIKSMAADLDITLSDSVLAEIEENFVPSPFIRYFDDEKCIL